MPDPSPTAYDVTLCVEDLRTALAEHGISLPSLRHTPPAGLIALGNCNTATARALASALRRTAAAER